MSALLSPRPEPTLEEELLGHLALLAQATTGELAHAAERDKALVWTVLEQLERAGQVRRARTTQRPRWDHSWVPSSPRPRLAAPTSPFQRLAQAVLDEPSRLWCWPEVVRVAHAGAPLVRLCLQRLVDEGLLEPFGDERWRMADRRMP